MAGAVSRDAILQLSPGQQGRGGRHYARGVTSRASDAIAPQGDRGAWTPPASPEEVETGLRGQGYLPGEGLSTSIFLAIELQRPLFLEGEPGVGKTEVANVLARWIGTPSCSGSSATRGSTLTRRSTSGTTSASCSTSGPPTGDRAPRRWREDELFSERFLVRRPLLQAIAGGGPAARPAGAADRRDRPGRRRVRGLPARDPGRLHGDRPRARHLPGRGPPGGRPHLEPHPRRPRRPEATRLYHWVEHPDFEREVAIVAAPGCPRSASSWPGRSPRAVQSLRAMGLYKPPGVAETIDWARALPALGRDALDEASAARTLGAVLKYREDAERAAARARRRCVEALRPLGVTDRSSSNRSAPARSVVAFCRILRREGLRVPCPTSSPSSMRSAAGRRAQRRTTVYWAGRATLVRRPEDIELYDRVFAAFWLDGAERPGPARRHRARSVPSRLEPRTTDGSPTRRSATAALRYSRAEVLRDKDFADCTPEELAEAIASMRIMPATEAVRPAHRGDLRARATRPDIAVDRFGRSMRSGGEIGPSGPDASVAAGPPAGPPVRRQRLDGALRPGAPAVRPRARWPAAPGSRPSRWGPG